jgi:FixJ family two-component response regulator
VSRPRIAIVDDEESIRRALKRLMISVGWDVDAYDSGPAFLVAAMNEPRPDCVVLDLHMPGMSGFDVLERLAQSGQKLPVVTITGHDAAGSEARVMAGGAAAYLRKPVNASVLLGAITAATGAGTGP